MHKIVSYKGWDDTHILSEGDLQIVIIPTIGGRIISMEYFGEEFCRQNESSFGKVSEQSGGDWLNWGGDFDWIGPQESWNTDGWPPPYMIDSAPWKVSEYNDSSIALQSEPCNLGISLQKKIIISDGQLRIIKTMTNCSNESKTFGIWNITQVKTKGIVSVPIVDFDQNDMKVFLNPSGNTVESLVNSDIVKISDNELAFDESKGNFKVGLISSIGQIRYELNGLIMDKLIESQPNVKYPHNCNIEVYRDEKSGYTELEQLWKMESLMPGESCTAEQKIVFSQK